MTSQFKKDHAKGVAVEQLVADELNSQFEQGKLEYLRPLLGPHPYLLTTQKAVEFKWLTHKEELFLQIEKGTDIIVIPDAQMEVGNPRILERIESGEFKTLDVKVQNRMHIYPEMTFNIELKRENKDETEVVDTRLKADFCIYSFGVKNNWLGKSSDFLGLITEDDLPSWFGDDKRTFGHLIPFARVCNDDAPFYYFEMESEEAFELFGKMKDNTYLSYEEILFDRIEEDRLCKSLMEGFKLDKEDLDLLFMEVMEDDETIS